MINLLDDFLGNNCFEINVYCPVCKTNKGHFNPCNPHYYHENEINQNKGNKNENNTR